MKKITDSHLLYSKCIASVFHIFKILYFIYFRNLIHIIFQNNTIKTYVFLKYFNYLF